MRRERMVAARKKLELSQVEMANKMGVTQRTVSSWESGKTGDITKFFRDISRSYNINHSELEKERTVEPTKAVPRAKPAPTIDEEPPKPFSRTLTTDAKTLSALVKLLSLEAMVEQLKSGAIDPDELLLLTSFRDHASIVDAASASRDSMKLN